MLNKGVTLNFWPKGSGVMNVFKKSLADGDIWFVEVEAIHKYKVYSYFILDNIMICLETLC